MENQTIWLIGGLAVAGWFASQWLKKSMTPEIIEPYYYSYTGNAEDEVLEINIVAPIMNKNRFVGVAGIDISMDLIMKTFEELRRMEGVNYYVITNSGKFLINPDSSFFNKTFSEFGPDIESKYNVSDSIKQGKTFNFIANDPLSNSETLFFFKAIEINNINTPWSICVSVPLTTVYHEANKSLTYTMSYQ